MRLPGGRSLPAGALLELAGILALVRLLSASDALRPYAGFVAAALFLYVPLLRAPAAARAGWLRVSDPAGSARTAVLLGLAGCLAFFAYRRLPLPFPFAPPAATSSFTGAFLAGQALLVALPEEVFFRGRLHDAFRAGGIGPVVPVSLLFAASHLVLGASPYRALTFFPSLLFGLGREKAGNVYVPAFLHFLFNLLPAVAGGAP